jgi:hypothetical protein
VDAEDRLLWRQRPRRLEAEAVRDAVLAVSGKLDAKMYGEPVATETRATGEIVAAGEEGAGRRSIYLMVRRSLPVTLLNSFDAPVMETNCTRRQTSTTVTQALALLNGSFLAAQAGHFADRVLREAPDNPAAALQRAYMLAFGRPASPAEQARSRVFLGEQEGRYRSAGDTLEAARRKAWADFCQALLSSNEFVYMD